MLQQIAIYIPDTLSSLLFKSSRVSITLGVDATALIPAYQICHSHGVIVGGAAPNHYISLEGLDKDGVAKLLKECLDGEHGQLASEIKVVVLTFQQTPPGMSPYLVLVGRPQSKNENTDWVTEGKSKLYQSSSYMI